MRSKVKFISAVVLITLALAFLGVISSLEPLHTPPPHHRTTAPATTTTTTTSPKMEKDKAYTFTSQNGVVFTTWNMQLVVEHDPCDFHTTRANFNSLDCFDEG